MIAATGTKKDQSLKLRSLFHVIQHPGLPFGPGEHLSKEPNHLFMHFHNVRFLGSLAAFALLGVNAGQAQSTGPIPANISSGFAKFTPNSKIVLHATKAGYPFYLRLDTTRV
jgi:hypothetical protein